MKLDAIDDGHFRSLPFSLFLRVKNPQTLDLLFHSFFFDAPPSACCIKTCDISFFFLLCCSFSSLSWDMYWLEEGSASAVRIFGQKNLTVCSQSILTHGG